jgi:hypothetical protein
MIEYIKSDKSFLNNNQAEYAINEIIKRMGIIDCVSMRKIKIIINSYDRSMISDFVAGTQIEFERRSFNLQLNKDVNYITPEVFIPKGVPFLVNVVEDADGNLNYHLGFDIVAIVFIVLSGWYDIDKNKTDEHGRYDENSCFAVKYKLFKYPFIDEWCNLLVLLFNEKDVVVEPINDSKICFTQDIDHFQSSNGCRAIISKVIRDIRYKSISPFWTLENILSYFNFNNSNDDNIDSINCTLDLLKKLKLKGIFFIKSSVDSTKYDSGYDLDDKKVQLIIKKIVGEGHRLGWHPSYYASSDHTIFDAEFMNFYRCVGFYPKIVRFHYLRYSPLINLPILENYKISEDYSVGFSKRIGFRVGTNFPYLGYNFKKDEFSSITFYPLILMDDPLFSFGTNWIGVFRSTLNLTAYHSGKVCILFHNSRLMLKSKFLAQLEDCLNE